MDEVDGLKRRTSNPPVNRAIQPGRGTNPSPILTNRAAIFVIC
jgi:hypothetical protein